MPRWPQKETRPHDEEIKARLRIVYGTLGAFEKAAGLPKGSVSDCMRKGRPEVERAIALALGTTAEALWPERFVRKGWAKKSKNSDMPPSTAPAGAAASPKARAA